MKTAPSSLINFSDTRPMTSHSPKPPQSNLRLLSDPKATVFTSACSELEAIHRAKVELRYDSRSNFCSRWRSSKQGSGRLRRTCCLLNMTLEEGKLCLQLDFPRTQDRESKTRSIAL